MATLLLLIAAAATAVTQSVPPSKPSAPKVEVFSPPLLPEHPGAEIHPAVDFPNLLRPLPVFSANVLPPPMRKNTASVPEGFHYPELGRSVVAAEPIIATRLAGGAMDEVGHPVERALVELMTPHWRKRISARFTDDAGRFDFGITKSGRYLLKVTTPGFAPLLARVTVLQSGPPGVTLTLHLAN